jgi:16S rRNA (cytosine967-C5)-methyltransferase
MAAFQKHFLERVPDHAIANDTVEIAKRTFRMHQRDVAFLNAVVRRVVSAESVRVPAGEQLQDLATQFSHPEWLAVYLEKKFGAAHTRSILAANNTEPELTLRVNTMRSSVTEITNLVQELGGVAHAGVLCPEAIRVTDVPTQALVQHGAFVDGQFYLQDEGSQAVAYVLAPRTGERILDLCAAPGGKATHLAELGNGEVQVVATDISPTRLKSLRENLARLRTPGVEVVGYEDLLNESSNAQLFDAVLVDAPCSGLGTLRRNPEIRYRVTMEQVSALGEEQFQVLARAARLVKPGGRLVYSTCTVTDEENKRVIERFLSENSEFAISPKLAQRPAAIDALHCEDGFFRTWPNHLTVDGFEAVVLRRK